MIARPLRKVPDKVMAASRHRMPRPLHASPIAISTLPPSTPSPSHGQHPELPGTAWTRHRCAAARQPRRPRTHPAEAAQRLATHSPNRLAQPGQTPGVAAVLLQFHNVLILRDAGGRRLVTAALGHWLDTGRACWRRW